MPEANAKPKTKAVELTEDVTSRPGKVDREASVIENVKIVGLEAPKKNRRYNPQALRNAVPLYEGAKVNLNHPRPEDRDRVSRRFEDRIGRLEGVEFREGDGLYARRLHYNPRHPAAESLIWWAENDPTGIGLSHVIRGVWQLESGVQVVEDIFDVKSVDIVADPATTRGMFEDDSQDDEGGEDVDLSKLTLDELRKARPELLTEAIEESKGGEEVEQLKKQVSELSESLDGYKKAEAKAALVAKAQKACADGGLKKEAITEAFVGVLVESSEDKWAALIDDRKAVAGASAKPLSREQGKVDGDDHLEEASVETDPKKIAAIYG